MCNGHYSILQQGSEQRLLPTHDHVSTEVTSKGEGIQQVYKTLS